MVFNMFKESHDNTVDLPDDEPKTIKRVIAFLYTQSYDNEEFAQSTSRKRSADLGQSVIQKRERESASSICAKSNKALSHLKVYQAADKLGIDHLKPHVVETLTRWSLVNWNSKAYFEMAAIAMEISPLHDHKLKHMISDTIRNHLRYFLQFEEFDNFITENGVIGLIVMEQLVQKDMLMKSRKDRISCLEDAIERMNAARHICGRCSSRKGVQVRTVSGHKEEVICSHCLQPVLCPETADYLR
ncbi:hypothetical protein N8T08_003839 [Aspergillus melleus]|uniref:Uncharacterized protein n=1 Tax=Aspergillus melleus TaxID=138277 RepID=A0ACC3B6L0_9EURO|nr:hypothetical protein N8T08_003839 [Aspergillus melleus]